MLCWWERMAVCTSQEPARGERMLIINQNQEGSQNHLNQRRCQEWKDIMS